MSTILKKRVPAIRRDTNLGFTPRKRWRERFARDILMRVKNVFLFIPFIVGMMTMGNVVWANIDPRVEPDAVLAGEIEPVKNASSDKLIVVNPQKTGEYGVSFKMPDNTTAWHSLMEHPDADNSLPDGASIEIVTKGVVDGKPDQLLGTMIRKKVDGKWQYALQNNLGVDSYTLETYSGDTLVSRQESIPASTLKEGFLPFEKIENEFLSKSGYIVIISWGWCYINEVWYYCVDIAVYEIIDAVKAPGLGPVESSILIKEELIKIIPEGMKSNITALSSVSMIAKDIPSFTVTELTVNQAVKVVEPASHDFGDVAVGSSATKKFAIPPMLGDHQTIDINVVENTIDEFGNVKTTKTDSNEFTISENGCGSGNHPPCNFSIEFQPKSVGNKTATVVVDSYAMDGTELGSLTVPLQGTGIEAAPGPKISVEPMSHDFGDVYVGFSDYHMFKVSNVGIVKFKIGKITISELTTTSNGGSFFIKNDYCSYHTLNSKQSCFVVVRFTPPVIGGKSANLLIPYGPKTPVYVSLKGTGVDWCKIPPIVKVNPNPIDFGSVPIGSSTSMPVSVYMHAKNCVLPLKIDNITVTGKNKGEFAILKPLWCKSGIYGNTSYSYCKSKLIFNAAKPAGIKDAKLEIAFNDSSTKIVPINAKSILKAKPQLSVTPTSHNFGSVVIGTSSKHYKFTVKNTGNVSLQFSKIGMLGGDAKNFLKNSKNCSNWKSLSPGNTCSIDVVFKPQNPPGKKWTNLAISFFSPPLKKLYVEKVKLTGVAVAPKPCSDASITIETANSGNWNDPSIWNTGNPQQPFSIIPGPNDIVRINDGHTVTAPSTTINVKALCIEKDGTEKGGTLESKYSFTDLRVEAKERIENKGTIRRQDDDGGISSASGSKGASILLNVGKVCYLPWALDKPVSSIRSSRRPALNQNIAVPYPYYWCYYKGRFYNEGNIIAGDGKAGKIFGRRGGDIKIRAGDITIKRIGSGPLLVSNVCKNNYGAICAGNGSAGQPGADGGNISIKARNNPDNQSFVYMYRPYIWAGNGGKGIDGLPGGNGGDLRVRGYAKIIWGSPIILKAGKGGIPYGNDGHLIFDPRILSISGDDTTISGGNVTLFGGEDATIELNGLNDGAITATGDLTVSVGEGGVIKSDSTNQFMKADGQVNLFADDIMLPEDVNVSDLTGDNVVIGSGQIMRDVSLTASGDSSGEPGVTLPLDLTL
ncbi:MAG: choice-of-anchor D domain-containing protein, partial [Thiomargarita sp.]|nr:choice-of-anchor D domain-containing protein [Thiomargarita sp.]